MPLTITHVGLPTSLQSLLRDTSRSFYLTLQVLPGQVRPQIGLAYLLARASDTIADTELVPVEERLAALDALRARILGDRNEPVELGRLTQSQRGRSAIAERRLLERLELATAQLPRLTTADLETVRRVLQTITAGQELDLRRFEVIETAPPPPPPGADGMPPVIAPPPLPRPAVGEPVAKPLRALATFEELDDYTYRVAGCVGEFWTDLMRRHCFANHRSDEAAFRADGIAFGKGLQLVNILRDLPRDLQNGRCYLPADRLERLGLSPRDLLAAGSEPRLRPLYRELVELAFRHLEAGWRYTNTIPFGHFRLRLACAWPVLIGVRTLVKLLAGNPLDPRHRIRVDQAEVRQILVGSILRLPARGAWVSQFQRALE
jgi:farnesyl-diphosphate farnesyltransferase